MKLLVIEPMGIEGHIAFNKCILSILSSIGEVTFVSSPHYLKKIETNNVRQIPISYYSSKSKIGFRYKQILVLKKILKTIPINTFDNVIFLGYETISMSLSWPRKIRTFVFEHNNISNAQNSFIKMFFLKYLPRNIIHLTFMEHIAEYLRRISNREINVVPFPYCKTEGMLHSYTNQMQIKNKKIIFSPSSQTPESLIGKLITIIKDNHEYYLISKGSRVVKESNYEMKTHFDEYYSILNCATLVFIGGDYKYRISGVVYEAFTYCKPVVMLQNEYANELKKQFPGLVYIINNLEDIIQIKVDYELLMNSYNVFERAHSNLQIEKILSGILSIR